MPIKSTLPISGNTVLLIGNWSYKNLGDELILLGTVKLLLKQQKSLIISCYDPKRLQHFFSQFIDTKQITFIHELPKGFRSFFQWLKKGGLKQLRYFWKTDTIILGGGEILTEENPSAYRYRLVGMRPFLLRVIARSLRRGNPKKCHTVDCVVPLRSTRNDNLYIMGGIQIPRNKRRKHLFRFLLNRTTHLYLRDFQAVEEIKKFGYNKVEFFMDTSYFAYDWNKIPSKTSVVFPPDKGKGASLRAEGGLSTKTPYIIVNLNKNGERFLSDIVKDLQPYVNKGYTIYFVSIAKGKNTYYNDVQYKHLLEQHLENSPKFSGKFSEILLLDWEHNFAHFVHMLKNAELVISTRLHLFLLASFLGVQTKVYPYQRKILKMQEVIKSCKENLCEKIP